MRPLKPSPRLRQLPLLATLLLLTACAHAPRTHDADLTGTWHGAALPQGRDETRGLALDMDLVVTGGRVTGTGELSPAGGVGREGRAVQVTGEFRGGRAILRVEPEGLGPHTLRLRLTGPGQLEGSLDLDLRGGGRMAAGRGYPMQIKLTRVEP